MKTSKVKIDTLKLDPSNLRKHDARNIDAIKASLSKFGQQKPIVVSKDDIVIAGNGTLEAAIALGWQEIAVVQSSLTGAEATTYAIADNRTTDLSEWVHDDLAATLEALRDDESIDELVTGFSADEISDLIGGDGLEDEGEVPEPPTDPITKLGDVWTLGRHRLVCGDCTDDAVLDSASNGTPISLCFTDPPYGVGWSYDQHDDSSETHEALVKAIMPKIKARCDVVALTPGVSNIWLYGEANWILCWFYGAGTGRGPWGFTAWQPILVWGKDPKLANGEGSHPDGFQFMMSHDDADENKQLKHSCPKPLSVWQRFLERLTSDKSSLVFDPFAGSGTTLIACETHGIDSCNVELSPAYCDVIVERWQNLTGEKAVRNA